MQEPLNRQRGGAERHEVATDLHDVVSPQPLGLDPQWGVSRSAGSRCRRCRRRLRAGEPVLQSGDDGVFCGLCGRRHWLRRLED
jgi:hypothetical protein